MIEESSIVPPLSKPPHSKTHTMPIWGFNVMNAYPTTSTCHFIRALSIVLFPAFGNPMRLMSAISLSASLSVTWAPSCPHNTNLGDLLVEVRVSVAASTACSHEDNSIFWPREAESLICLLLCSGLFSLRWWGAGRKWEYYEDDSGRQRNDYVT
jgi:hypothetical protein